MSNTFSNISIFAQANTQTPAATATTQAAPAADVPATDQPQQQGGLFGGGSSMIIVYVLIFVGLWFLLIMPQRKRQKAIQKLQAELQNGDNVVTTSGIIGKIVSIDATQAVLQVSAGTQITFLRAHIVGKTAE